MKNNEEYMILGYDFWHNGPVLERKDLASKPPHIKRWRGSVHSLQKNTKVMAELQPGKYIALKIKASTTKIEGYFGTAGKLLRTEL